MNTVLTPPKISVGKLSRLSTRVKAIIFGDSGVGKTSLLLTAVRPLLVVNVDNSLSSIADPNEENIYVYPDPAEERPVKSWEELEAVLGWLETTGIRELGLQTVAFDTITEAGHLLREKLLGEDGPTRRTHEQVLSMADYGVFGELMLDMVRRIRDLPCDVVLTAQVQDLVVEKEKGGVELIRYPSFGGGKMAAASAPPHFDIVGYLGLGMDGPDVIRRLLVQPLDNKRAKIRTRPGVTAPATVDRPNLADLMNLVKSYKE